MLSVRLEVNGRDVMVTLVPFFWGGVFFWLSHSRFGIGDKKFPLPTQLALAMVEFAFTPKCAVQ